MNGGSTFIRSKFEYATRQRQTYCNDYMVKFNFICKDRDTMKNFKNFYYQSLRNGQHSFFAEWEVEGIDTQKEFRFADIYTSSALGNGIYRVEALFEMITKIKDL